VVAINSLDGDSAEEHMAIASAARKAGAADAVVSTHFAEGGKGAQSLARAVLDAAESGQASWKPLYELSDSPEKKIEMVATRIYGAGSLSWSDSARSELDRISGTPAAEFPVCIAKTWASLSHDPSRLGAPSGFVFPVREIRILSGAGFILAIAGETQTMPGLPRDPAYSRISLSPDGTITGIV
jgi:formate--tetrahydrofolate ligase